MADMKLDAVVYPTGLCLPRKINPRAISFNGAVTTVLDGSLGCSDCRDYIRPGHGGVGSMSGP